MVRAGIAAVPAHHRIIFAENAGDTPIDENKYGIFYFSSFSSPIPNPWMKKIKAVFLAAFILVLKKRPHRF